MIQLALDYSPDIFQSLLDLDIQNRNMHQVKAEMSPTLQVFASMGLAQSGSTINEVYQQPFNEQQLRAGLSIPIVDWGRKRAAITSSKLQIEMTHLDLESRRQSLSNRVSQRYFDMQEISTRLKLQTELINLSEERYRISKERYTAGAILITELVFAQRNKDQAIRDYLISLRDYYVAYYDLRRLTGYDIKTGTLIQQ